ncbi:MAG: exodeoxyribonuclease III [Proteobacteria bacterium]|nr:exodeoxyribonuclease III [Pseudomonadota bacterium]
MRIVSWNVNGLRACAKKGFTRWLAGCGAEIVGVQEVRADPRLLPNAVHAPAGWFTNFSAATRAGYSGVGLYSRRPIDALRTALGQADFDAEGRLQLAHFGRLVVANVYFPNGSGSARDNGRVPFKLAFYRALFAQLERLRRADRHVLVIGDFNTAHQAIDLARPQANRGTSGFLAEERAELDRWLRAGWVDTFRHFEGGPGHYSWWSQRGGVRARNIGWRIDYVLACSAALRHVRAAFIDAQVKGSDHCPVGVDVDPAITA